VADKLTEDQLSAIISQQIELAKSHYQNGRATARDKALDYYFGRMEKYVPAETNRSKVVSRDVADTIGWLMPQIMRVFTASGSMFVAEPVEPEDVQFAEGATDGLNYVFWKDNKGYEVVYSATWDSLLHGDGIVKTFFDDTPVYGPAKTFNGLTEDHLALLAGDDSVDVLAKTETEGMAPDEFDAPMPVKLYDVKVRIKKHDGRFVITAIPPEEFLISEDAVTVEDAAFKAHWQRKTRSDLVAMGYDKEDIWAIPEASRNETPEEQARRFAITTTQQATDKSTELVDYFECYPMIDADGDGVAEMLRVCYAGTSKLLDWEVWEDEDPFDNIPCEPIPHRWDSRSVADEEFDVQDVKTVLSRQLLNNIYWANNPQRAVIGKVKNPDQLDNPTFGGTIILEPGSQIVPLETPNVASEALQGIAYMDEVSARRTGVNSQSMALDPEVLQNQSATANQNASDASRSQPELIARNMAEYGWTKVGRKLLRLMAAHPEQRTIIVKGEATPIDPSTWNPDMHVNVNTGLGTGSRDRDAMMLGQVLQQQIAYTDRISVAFPGKGLDMLPYIHNTVTRFAEATGLKNPELYWPEIDPEEIEAGKEQLAQPKPNPKLEEIQATGEVQKSLKEVDAQVSMQAAQLKAEGDVVKNQAELEADLQTKEADRQNAIAIESIKQQGAERIEAMRIASAERIKAAELAQQRELESARMANAQTIAAMKPQPMPTGKPAN
jgi:hypothetical protein